MALVDRITWALFEADLRTYLGVTTGEDFDLEIWFESAVECADLYLGEDRFQDEETGADLPIPRLVELGVYEWVRVMRNVKVTNTVTSGSTAVGAVKTIKTGDNSVTYETTASAGSGSQSATELAFLAASSKWCQYRPDVLLGI